MVFIEKPTILLKFIVNRENLILSKEINFCLFRNVGSQGVNVCLFSVIAGRICGVLRGSSGAAQRVTLAVTEDGLRLRFRCCRCVNVRSHPRPKELASSQM